MLLLSLFSVRCLLLVAVGCGVGCSLLLLCARRVCLLFGVCGVFVVGCVLLFFVWLLLFASVCW